MICTPGSFFFRSMSGIESFQSNSIRNIATIHRIAFPYRNIGEPMLRYIMNVECYICIRRKPDESSSRLGVGISFSHHKYRNIQQQKTLSRNGELKMYAVNFIHHVRFFDNCK